MKRPLLWPLMGFMLGIFSTTHFVISANFTFIFLSFSILFLLLSVKIKHKILFCFSSLFIFAFLGNFIAFNAFKKVESDSNLASFVSDQKKYVLGEVSETCEIDENGSKLVIDVWEIGEGSLAQKAQGKMMLRVGGGESCDFVPGDVIQTYTRLKLPERYQNAYSFDYPFYLKLQEITTTAYVESKEFVVKRAESHLKFSPLFEKLKSKSLQSILQIKDPESREILSVLLLGSSQSISKSTQELFRKTGTTHLLVVSGLHLAMLMGLFYFSFRVCFSLWPGLLLRVSVKKLAFVSALFPVIFYSLLVGLSPSVLRSVSSVILIGVLLLWNRKKDGLSLLFLVAFGILFFFPLMLFNLSFQLTFLSILSMILGVGPLERLFEARWPQLTQKKWFQHLLQIILATFVVQIGLLPILLTNFHQLSLVSIPANLFLIPYFSFILMPLGMLALIASWFHAGAGAFLFQFLATALQPSLVFLKCLAAWKWSLVYVAGMNSIQILSYVLLIAVFFIPLSKSKMKVAVLIFGLLNVAAWAYPIWSDTHNPNLRLSFLDVGQGDALLIEFPLGKKMLVDAGGMAQSSFDVGEQVLLPSLLGRGIRRLDYLVLTHPHPDHFGGMQALLKAYHPQEVWWNGEKVQSPEFISLWEELEKMKIPRLQKSKDLEEIDIHGVKISFLHPAPDIFFPNEADAATLNNHSLVMSLEDRGLKILLSGDIQLEAEKKLLDQKTLGEYFILKVPHHGSNTSSSEEFISRLQPKIALIGVGRNNHWGFPKTEVLDRYQKNKTDILRTDQNGEIDLTWDGIILKGKDFRGQEYDWKPIPNLVDASPKGTCKESSC